MMSRLAVSQFDFACARRGNSERRNESASAHEARLRLRLAVVPLFVLLSCSASAPATQVRSVEPSELFLQTDTDVLIHGDFRAIVKVDFDKPGDSTRNAQFRAQVEQGDLVVGLFEVQWVSAETLRARVPSGLSPGAWALRVTDPALRQVRLDDAIVVLDCAVSTCVLADGGVLDGGSPVLLPDGGLRDGGAPDAGVPDAGPQPCATLTLADDDGDGFGLDGSGALLCGAGRTTTPGDCNDLDPDVHVGGIELCNRLDDDCDGLTDESVCPVLNPNWIRRLDAPQTIDFATLSMVTPGRLWIAGESDVWGRLDGGFFEASSTGCPNQLRRSWASPAADVFVGGGNPALGRLSAHGVSEGGCSNTRMLSDPFAAIWGSVADGGVRVEGVLRNTRRFEWSPPGQPIETSTNLSTSDIQFEDADRLGSSVWAVGSSEGDEMRVYSASGTNAWSEQRLGLNLPGGSLRGVNVVSATSVFAVGDRGVVIEKAGSTWRRLPSPSGATLTAVRAFNPARVYVSGSDGTVRKWNGQSWQVLYSNDGGASLNDLDGLTESDLWAVGNRGWIVHWPE